MTLAFALFIYAAAMTLANLSVAQWGPSVTAINAFVLIGLDLALRDWLHVRLKLWQMGALICGTSLLTYILAPAAQTIAIASAVSFGVAAVADWLAFSKLQGSWLRRSMGSNVVGAAVDSLLFPTMAFGALLPAVVLAQFVAKVAGGALWSLVIARMSRRTA